MDKIKAALLKRLDDETATARAFHRDLRRDWGDDRTLAVVRICGDITEQTATDAVDAMRRSPRAQKVHVLIDSTGGNVAATFSILAELKAHRGVKHAYASNMCASAALLIFASCRYRIADTNCLFIHHSARGAKGDDAGVAAVNAIIMDTLRACGTPDQMLRTLRRWGDLRDPRSFNAAEALIAGVATEVKQFAPVRQRRIAYAAMERLGALLRDAEGAKNLFHIGVA